MDLWWSADDLPTAGVSSLGRRRRITTASLPGFRRQVAESANLCEVLMSHFQDGALGCTLVGKEEGSIARAFQEKPDSRFVRMELAVSEHQRACVETMHLLNSCMGCQLICIMNYPGGRQNI